MAAVRLLARLVDVRLALAFLAGALFAGLRAAICLHLLPSACFSSCAFKTWAHAHFLASIELGDIYRVGAWSAYPAKECVFDDEDLHGITRPRAVEIEDVRMLLGVVLAESPSTEPTDPESALATVPAVHLSAPTRG